jgi:hypothetical protein
MAGQKHGRPAKLAVVEYGESAYTDFANLTGEFSLGVEGDMVDLSEEHGVTLMQRLADPMIKITEITFAVNLDHDEGGHDTATGLQKWAATWSSGLRESTSILYKGPDYSAPDTDVIEVSGYVTRAVRVAPPNAAYRLDCTFVPDGTLLKMDATTIT